MQVDSVQCIVCLYTKQNVDTGGISIYRSKFWRLQGYVLYKGGTIFQCLPELWNIQQT